MGVHASGYRVERLSFSPHWRKTSASAKAALGAIGRLIGWEPGFLRYLLQERVLPLLLFSLGPCAPTTSESWGKANGVLRYAAHRLINRWDVHGEALLRLAELPSAEELAGRLIVSLAASAVFGGRRIGSFMERGLASWEVPSREGLRVASSLPAEELRPALLPLQLPRYAVLRSHLPSRLPLIWRTFALESQATSPESLLQLSRVMIPSDTITSLVEILTH